MEQYIVKGKIISVYDGDTFVIDFDLGFFITIRRKCRLLGVNSPEIRTRCKKEKELGYKARDFVKELILGKTFTIKTHKPGKFGRYLIDLFLSEEPEITLNNVLVEKGFARNYDGGRREKWFR